jgi:hypothetical protein
MLGRYDRNEIKAAILLSGYRTIAEFAATIGDSGIRPDTLSKILAGDYRHISEGTLDEIYQALKDKLDMIGRKGLKYNEKPITSEDLTISSLSKDNMTEVEVYEN